MSRQEIIQIAGRVAEGVATSIGVEIVEVEYVKESGTFYLRVFIDRDGGVTLNDCEAFSHAFSDEFDEIDPIPGSYSLEISSPGAERPLTRAEHYTRFAGRKVAVKTYAPIDGRKNWKGVLQGLEKDQVVLVIDGEKVGLPLAAVASARLVADFEESLRQGANRK